MAYTLAVFCILQVLDIHSTRQSMAVGGVEANPINPGMAWIVERLWLFILVKVIVSGMVVWVMWANQDYLLAQVGSIGIVIFYLYIVVHNYRLAARLRK